ncbi:HIT domain-containing protein [Candidatus Woesearchaeota archaeon]|nr:HIT domain-containing protein [Candidatus Woesearchaeota archaeon]
MPELTEEQRKQLEEKIKKMSPEELKEFQKQQCIFCQLISGKIPSKKVYDDEKCIAVLDIAPASKGHLLIMPKEHYAIMPQIPDKEIGHLFLVSKYLSQVLLKVLKVSGTNVFVANGAVAGQRAQHFMLHLIPRKEGDKIIEVEDKLIDAGLRAKVKELVEKRLKTLLGVKEEKQAALPKGEQNVPEEKSVPEEESAETKEETAEPDAEEETAAEEKVEEKPAKTTKKASKKSSSKLSSSKKNKPKDEPESAGDASLDDIANLFK